MPPERDDLGRFASPGAHGEEPAPRPEPKNYFREESGGFNIDLPSTPEPQAREPAQPAPETPRPAREEAPPAPEAPAPDPAKEAAERALAEMLGYKDAPPDRDTTKEGKPWLTPKQWIEKFSPQKTREELDALKRDVDRQVSERVGRELDGVRGQIAATVELQRKRLEQDWRRHIANAPDAPESLRRQQAATESLTAFDQQFAQPTARPTASSQPPQGDPEIPPTYVEAFNEFAERNKAWFNPDVKKPGGNRSMTAFAQDVVVAVARDPRFAGDPKAEFAEIERRVREEYKEHPLFRSATPANGQVNGSHTPPKAPDIQGAPRRGGGGGGGQGWGGLTDAQKQMFHKVHVPFGSFKDTDKERDRYAAQIHADTGKKRGFDIQ